MTPQCRLRSIRLANNHNFSKMQKEVINNVEKYFVPFEQMQNAKKALGLKYVKVDYLYQFYDDKKKALSFSVRCIAQNGDKYIEFRELSDKGAIIITRRQKPLKRVRR